MTYASLTESLQPDTPSPMDRRLQDRMAALDVHVLPVETSDRVALLRATDGTPEVLVGGMAIEAAHAEHPARAAAAWREHWYRLWKRSQLPAKLIAFFDEINVAETPESISASVAEHALEMVGGYKAVVFLPDAAEGKGGESAEAVALLRESRFGQAGLVMAPDFREVAERWWQELGAFLADPQIAMVAHVPFGERGVLLVAERRSDRVFDADDWEVLGTLAEQGDRALARIRLLVDAYELSLTDPLTGLANRRQMEVVLKHAWAAAERGEGLAVMMLDLDGFKALNDSYGHSFGDQILEIAADCIREEARGADAAIRYGGDEFLVILPRGTTASGRSLAGRIKARLEGWVGISAGVAEYHPSYMSPMDIINAADEDLYRSKALRSLERPVRPN
jgi:diguanylate cyclase (GGDEF)-like protein